MSNLGKPPSSRASFDDLDPAQALEAARRELAAWQRWGQVEEALERVRAQSMAMHHSDELAEVATVMFRAFGTLTNIETGTGSGCWISIMDPENDVAENWGTDFEGATMPISFHLPQTDHPVLAKNYEAWKRREPLIVTDLSRAAFIDYTQYIASLPDFATDPVIREALANPPERYLQYEASFSQGVVGIGSVDVLAQKDTDLLQRFARVFEQTYTRFLDLKKAEEQAREAVQQASLDRVRAEIASMRSTDDLQRITPLIWRELTTLGVPFFRCGVFIIDDVHDLTHTYLSTPDGTSLAALHLPFESTPLVREAVDHWRSGHVYTDLWDREQFVAWVAALVEEGHLDATEAYQGGEEPPETLALHFLPFTQGMLYVGSSSPLADDQIDLVQSLASTFAVAYARYEDFTRLEMAKAEVEAALADLKATQQQLIHAEKMASLGQMTAGIAHEIKNPLNFVNNFAELIEELAGELRDDLADGAAPDDIDDLLDTLQVNAAQIAKHGKRADAIVRAMMQHARGTDGRREPTNVNTLVNEYLNLAYHGLRASTPSFNATLDEDYDEAVGAVELVPQEIGRVLLNLLSNAFYAVYEKTRDTNSPYAPTVSVRTRRHGDSVEIRVRDNGPGIPEDVRAKIFEPFYTTKPTGSGTGLGLSLAYDIITQGHGGTLTADSTENEGATFTITIPATPPPLSSPSPPP